MKLFKLITEANSPNFTAIKDIVIKEEKASDGSIKKVTEIVGPFIQCEVKNRNGRIYPKSLMEECVQKYVNDRMTGNKYRSYGELGHPEGIEINLHRVSHMITELRWEGNNVLGRAKLLDTEYGRVADTIIKADGQLGTSSRGMGALNSPNQQKPGLYEDAVSKFGQDSNIVTEFELIAEDIVADPSAPQGFVNGIYENKQYIIAGGQYTESSIRSSVKAYDNLTEALSSLPKKDRDGYLINQIEKFLNDLSKPI
jgi:hypothetical protein